MSLRSKTIRLASTFPKGSKERKALLEVLAVDESLIPDLPKPRMVAVPKLSESQKMELQAALAQYPEPVRTSRGGTSKSLLMKGLLEQPKWLPLGDSGYSADFYPLTKEGFEVAQAVYYEYAMAAMRQSLERLTARGREPEKITRSLERGARRHREHLSKRWKG